MKPTHFIVLDISEMRAMIRQAEESSNPLSTDSASCGVFYFVESAEPDHCQGPVKQLLAPLKYHGEGDYREVRGDRGVLATIKRRVAEEIIR